MNSHAAPGRMTSFAAPVMFAQVELLTMNAVRTSAVTSRSVPSAYKASRVMDDSLGSPIGSCVAQSSGAAS
eukprot:6188924-Pleurochrysis_carterae.AAC.1